MNDPVVAHVLEETIMIFRSSTWVRGAPRTMNCHCLMTAVGKSVDRLAVIAPDWSASKWLLARDHSVSFLFKSLPEDYRVSCEGRLVRKSPREAANRKIGMLVEWNDHHAQNKDEVVGVVFAAYTAARGNLPPVIGVDRF